MGLGSCTPTRARYLLALLAAACGQASDEDAGALRGRLSGFYSTSVSAGQVDPANTAIEIFEFNEDGTGTYQRLSCTGDASDKREFAWVIDVGATHADILFEEDYVNADGDRREGQWFFPGEGCEQGTSSLAEFNFDGNACTFHEILQIDSYTEEVNYVTGEKYCASDTGKQCTSTNEHCFADNSYRISGCSLLRGVQPSLRRCFGGEGLLRGGQDGRLRRRLRHERRLLRLGGRRAEHHRGQEVHPQGTMNTTTSLLAFVFSL